jgi:NAD(P)-dependent dehydrogenase (short-subunit alcohol dehydrogenase family)
VKLITAGTSRIGQEIVKRLGDDVLVHYHNNRSLAESLSPFTIQADLTTTEGIRGFLSKLERFDVIINNFALVDDPKLDIYAWENMFRANVILPALLIEHTDKVVINISSIMGLPKIDCRYGYGMSKAALNKLTDTYHRGSVRINAVAPAEVGAVVSASDVADEVLRIINDETINNQIIYLWGNAPESQKGYAT